MGGYRVGLDSVFYFTLPFTQGGMLLAGIEV
jgi:hypothetical protein